MASLDRKGPNFCRSYLPCQLSQLISSTSFHDMFTVACSGHTELACQLGNFCLVKSSGLAALPTLVYSMHYAHQMVSYLYQTPSLALSAKHTHQRNSYPRAMFNPSSSSAPTCSDLSSMHHAVSFSSDLPTVPTEIPCGNSFFHDNGGLFPPLGMAASAPPPYTSSLRSYYIDGNGGLFSPLGLAASAPPPYTSPLHSYYINRSASSHSLPLYEQFPDPLGSNAAFSCPSPSAFQLPILPVSSSPSSSSGDFLEFSSSDTMRRVVSTGDLQGNNVLLPPPVPPRSSGENCSQEAGEPFSEKVGRYSAEERKERIERYRSKRQQRNFQKKITYACRKTLADSRPRVQGRFARNVETEGDAATDVEMEASDISYDYSSYNDLSGSNCYDSQSQYRETGGDSMVFDDSKWWWWATPVAANGQQPLQQSLGFDVVVDVDEDQLWASLADMCSGT